MKFCKIHCRISATLTEFDVRCALSNQLFTTDNTQACGMRFESTRHIAMLSISSILSLNFGVNVPEIVENIEEMFPRC